MDSASSTYQRFLPPRRETSRSTHVIRNETILNGHLSAIFLRRITIVNQLINYAIVLHLILLHCYFEADRQSKQSQLYFLWGSQICGVFTVVWLVLGHTIVKQYMSKMHKKEQQVLPLVLNCAISLVMPYSFLQNRKLYFNDSINNEQLYVSDFKLNYLLTVCSCTRIIWSVTSILVSSKYSSARAARVCALHGSFSGLLYPMKSLFKEQPFTFIMTIFLSSVLVFSACFRIAECEFISQHPGAAYMNMMWMTTITMTTVGFGDYTPSTPIGRLVGVICMTWGALIVSVMVGVLTQALALTTRQSQALITFKRLQKQRQVKDAAGKYLRVALWRVWTTWKYSIPLNQDLKQREKKHYFRTQRLSYQLNRNVGLKVDVAGKVRRLFMQTEIDINYLLVNSRRLINFISEQFVFGADQRRPRKLNTQISLANVFNMV